MERGKQFRQNWIIHIYKEELASLLENPPIENSFLLTFRRNFLDELFATGHISQVTGDRARAILELIESNMSGDN